MIARQNRRLDRPRPTPARQQGRMDIQAAAPRGIQHGFGQNQAISRNHRHIQTQSRKGSVFGFIALQPRRVAHGQAQFQGSAMHRTGRFLLPAPGGFRRLAINRGDLMPRIMQGAQRRHREIRAAHEGQAQRALLAVHSRCWDFRSLANLRRIILRLSVDRWSTNKTPSRWSISCCRQAESRPSPSISRLAPVRSR